MRRTVRPVAAADYYWLENAARLLGQSPTASLWTSAQRWKKTNRWTTLPRSTKGHRDHLPEGNLAT
jgi:hypothetical protein